MPRVLTVVDGPALRRWAETALAALVHAAPEIDALNVFPVADADTGSNLVRTLRAGVAALPGTTAGTAPVSVADAARILARGMLVGASGSSGTILSQILRGVAEVAAETAGSAGAAGTGDGLDGTAVAGALRRAAVRAREAVARPREGTILSVADAAAEAAQSAAASGGDLAVVTAAAHRAARSALDATPGQLAELAGRVDAGARGLVVVLAALESVVTDVDAATVDAATDTPVFPTTSTPVRPAAAPPLHEVMYLLDVPHTDAQDEVERVGGLRRQLAELAQDVVVVGGGGLWQVHAHVDDIGAVLEAGIAAGRPHRVRVTRLDRHRTAGLGVVAVLDTAGLEPVLASATVSVVVAHPGVAAQDLAGQVASAVAALDAPVVAVLPGGDAAREAVALLVAADPTSPAGMVGAHLHVVGTRSAVQVVASTAVHDAERDPAQDLLAMSTAAAACRDGLVEVAQGEGLTSAGWCRQGDVLGHVSGDVAVIGRDLAVVAGQVVDLLLGGGGELVTLVAGSPAPEGLLVEVAAGLRRRRPDVEVTSYDGGQPASYLLVGVE